MYCSPPFPRKYFFFKVLNLNVRDLAQLMWLNWLECLPIHQKVMVSILIRTRGGGNRSISVSLSPPSFLRPIKINNVRDLPSQPYFIKSFIFLYHSSLLISSQHRSQYLLVYFFTAFFSQQEISSKRAKPYFFSHSYIPNTYYSALHIQWAFSVYIR